MGFDVCVGAKEEDAEKSLQKLKTKLFTSVSLSTSALAESKLRFEAEYPINEEFSYVGSGRPPRPHDLKVTEVPGFLLEVLDDYPEIKKLRYPLRTAEQTMESLSATCSKGQRGGFAPYVAYEQDFVAERLQFDEQGPEAPGWAREFRLPTPREVLAVVAQLSDESNAGYPYCLYGGFKRSTALANFGATYRSVCDRILKLAEAEDLPEDPCDLVRRGFCDPVLAVEKDEPYDPTRKTCRTIIMGSLVDEIVDRLYTDPHDEFELLNFGRFHSLCGIGFTKEHLDFVMHCVSDLEDAARKVCPELQLGYTLAKNDVSGFDTNVFGEDALTEAEVLLRRYGFSPWGQDDEPWQAYLRRIVLNRTKCTFRSLFVFADGTLWKQRTFGIQKSGTKRTTSRNTTVRAQKHMRCAFRYHVGTDLGLGPSPGEENLAVQLHAAVTARGYDPRARPWWSMDHPTLGVGDDIIEPNYPGLRENYRRINVRIKDESFEACDKDEFEFCSHVWTRGAAAPRPLNAAKAAFRLLCGDPLPAKYVQWAYTYWHASDREKYINLFRRLGYPAGKNKQ